jgi:osmotically-inducible protein OsmY
MDACAMKRYAFLILALAACRPYEPSGQAQLETQKQVEQNAEARRPLADSSLADIVRQALLSDSSLDARKIDVENRNGNVSLNGIVDSPEQREKVERIVMSVGGVRSVTNNLAIRES